MDFYSKLDAGKRPLDYTKDQDNNLTHCNVAAKFKVEILVFGPNRIRLVTKGIRLIHTHTHKKRGFISPKLRDRIQFRGITYALCVKWCLVVWNCGS